MTDNLSDNELIAEFMGYRIGSDGVLSEYYQVPNHPPMYGIPAFHADWNLLMPVVEKIDSLRKYHVEMFAWPEKEFSRGQVKREYIQYRCRIKNLDADPDEAPLGFGDGNSRIESLYACVTEFIKWYSTTTKPV